MVGVLVICERGSEWFVLKEIKGMGDFKRTGFKEVLIGEVENLEAFLADIEAKPFIPISRVIPYEEAFHFSPENLLEILKERVGKYVDAVKTGKTFCVRMERRGFKGKLSSKEVEREIGSHLWKLLEERGEKPRVNLEDPDETVIIQTLGNLCLLGLIDKNLKQRHPLVRVK
ncbi:MAG: conserved hypothetical protein, containing THUMP domain, partial [Candidatus Hecatellales archaeon B24]